MEAVCSASAAEAGYTYNYQMFPDTPAAGDGVVFLWTATPGGTLDVEIDCPATYTGSDTMEWVYWNGSAWADLTVTSDTTNPDTTDGSQPFVDRGRITFTVPDDIASTTHGTQTGYAVMCRIATGKEAGLTQSPILAAAGPNRILVFDEVRGTMTTKLDPRNLLGATIGAMTAFRLPNATERMLVGLSDGRWLVWPSEDTTNAYADHEGENYHNYSTRYRCFAGQERRGTETKLEKYGLGVLVAANSRRFCVGLAGLDTGANTVIVATEQEVVGANTAQWFNVGFDGHRSGYLWQIALSTTASGLGADENEPNSPEWAVDDLILRTKVE